jgi:hypothetical protein
VTFLFVMDTETTSISGQIFLGKITFNKILEVANSSELINVVLLCQVDA